MLFNEQSVLLNYEAQNKDDVFHKLGELAVLQKIVRKPAHFEKSLHERERTASTGFENGFAIPHGISKKISEPGLFYVQLATGINWPAIDNKPTQYIFALGIPKKKVTTLHLDLLSEVARSIMNEEFTTKLRNANNPQTVYQIISNFLAKTENEHSSGNT